MKNIHSRRARLARNLLWILLPVVCLFAGLCLGRMPVGPVDAARSILGKLHLAEPPAVRTDTILWSMRMPRLLLSALAGAGLAVSGCSFQSLFSNPLATPDTLGVASGAGLGAALALLFGLDLIAVQLSALVFGLLAVVITALCGRRVGDLRSSSILAGIMVSSLFNSLISLVKFTADTESRLPAITYWLMGSMESAGYPTLLIGAPPILGGIVILLLLRWRMDLLPLSPDEATGTGADIRLLRGSVELCATLITASVVSMCGQVGWVGLLVPHICRMTVGSSNTDLLPASVSVGASFMILVDTLARTVSPREIPISILTAIIGAPFFIYLLRSKNRGWTL